LDRFTLLQNAGPSELEVKKVCPSNFSNLRDLFAHFWMEWTILQIFPIQNYFRKYILVPENEFKGKASSDWSRAAESGGRGKAGGGAGTVDGPGPGQSEKPQTHLGMRVA
jgi:hypothetical protein